MTSQDIFKIKTYYFGKSCPVLWKENVALACTSKGKNIVYRYTGGNPRLRPSISTASSCDIDRRSLKLTLIVMEFHLELL